MDAISQTTFSNAFSWMKMHKFRLRFHWSLFLRFKLTIFQHWFRWWLGAGQATSHYLNQWMMVSLLTHICVTRPQWVNRANHDSAYHFKANNLHMIFYWNYYQYSQLSLWQLPELPVMKIWSKRQYYPVSVYVHWSAGCVWYNPVMWYRAACVIPRPLGGNHHHACSGCVTTVKSLI